MYRQPFLIILLFSVFTLVGQITPVKIRVSKGHVKPKDRLYQDRIYRNQIEINLENKSVSRRDTEAEKFRLTNKSYPLAFSDTAFLNRLTNIGYDYSNPCKTPEKNFFYKIDFVYCDRYLSHIKTFEIPYNPASNDSNIDSVFKTILDVYVDLGK